MIAIWCNFAAMFEVFFSQVKDKVLLSEAEQKLVKTFFSPKKIRKKQYICYKKEISAGI
jgi:hypothetical protein